MAGKQSPLPPTVAWKSVTQIWIEFHLSILTHHFFPVFRRKCNKQGLGSKVTSSLLHALQQRLLRDPCAHVSLRVTLLTLHCGSLWLHNPKLPPFPCPVVCPDTSQEHSSCSPSVLLQVITCFSFTFWCSHLTPKGTSAAGPWGRCAAGR